MKTASRVVSMRRTRSAKAKNRAQRIIRLLEIDRPDAIVELDHRSPFELLVATILSAQCTDQRVNLVTPGLFRRYPTPVALAEADPAGLELLIRPTGFYRSKAKHLIDCSRKLVRDFAGKVPETMEELITLPGTGRKTANVLLGACFGKPAVVVDTHVKRVANRLGLTTSTAPDRIEEDLQRLLPETDWTAGAQRLLLHGRYVCVARKPQCGQCVLSQECAWRGKDKTCSRA